MKIIKTESFVKKAQAEQPNKDDFWFNKLEKSDFRTICLNINSGKTVCGRCKFVDRNHIMCKIFEQSLHFNYNKDDYERLKYCLEAENK